MRRHRRLQLVLVLAALAVGPAARAQDATAALKGLPLSAALRALQDAGLRIVFTSSIVTPDLRVESEPEGTTPRARLDALLAEHRLEARDGPGGTIQIVRARRPPQPATTPAGTIQGRVLHRLTSASLPRVAVAVDGIDQASATDAAGGFVVRQVAAGPRRVRASIPGIASDERTVQVAAGQTATVTLFLDVDTGAHAESLTVTGGRQARQDRGAAERRIGRRDWQRLSPGLIDHPARAVAALPGVSAADDFRSEFTVRGSALRHIGFVVDGVPAPWLHHTARGRGPSPSLTMLTGHALEDATLRAGAYPRRHGDRLGAELDLTLREGSRVETGLRGAVGGTNATLVGEGPIGRAARGSWLIAARQSLLEWPGEAAEASHAVLGFSDVLAKTVYDVTPRQQLAVTLVGGRSRVDGEDVAAAGRLGDGLNEAAMLAAAWRSAIGPSALLTQRAYATHQAFENRARDGAAHNGGSSTAIGYRADLATPIRGGILEAGAHVARGRTTFAGPPAEGSTAPMDRAVDATGWGETAHDRSGYIHYAWTPAAQLTISPGLRLSGGSAFPGPVVSRWILAEWRLRPGWALHASAGVSHQGAPPASDTAGRAPVAGPERAALADVGVEHQLTPAIRWQVTLFARDERLPERGPADPLAAAADVAATLGTLRGRARGIELLVQRDAGSRVSGWLSYAYGMARYADPQRGETFWADFDRRHAVNALATWRLTDRISAGATLRAGSNYPIPGRFAARNGSLFLASPRNGVRLPPYARLDVRADYAFRYLGRRLTIFAEVLNVTDRINLGLATGAVHPTGEAVGFTSPLFPRRLAAGVLIDF